MARTRAWVILSAMRLARPFLLAIVLSFSAVVAAPRTLVVCAPGYPGDTGEAQPTMDAFARLAEKAAGWKKGTLQAAYYATESEGQARLREGDAVLALVTTPFFHKYRKEARLEPKLQVAGEKGKNETWSLVARRGAIGSAGALAGFEVTGIPGFAPDFVRGPVLGDWGALPDSTRITFTSRVASAMIRAASGEKAAVLLDAEQAAALGGSPRGADLEIVHTSRPLPGSLLCTIEGRGGKDVSALLAALPHLHETAEGREILKVMRVTGFASLDADALDVVLGAPRRPVSAPR